MKNTIKKGKLRFLSFGILIVIISCKTYTIPTDDFKDQMANSSVGNLQEVKVNNTLHYSHHNLDYFANQIDTIFVVENNGQKTTLLNSPAIEMRITHKNGKKYTMYFDTVTLENDTLRGSRSRFLPTLTREIPYDSIAKIEVQEGGKKFKYVE